MTRLRSGAAIALAVAAALGAALSATPAAAEDEPPKAAAAGPAAPVPSGSLSLRAIDLSAMLATSRTSMRTPEDVPLGGRPVTVLVAASKGRASSTLTLRTDAAGQFEVPIAGIPAGTTLEFLVPDEKSSSRWPLYVSPSLTVGEPPPDALAFLQVEDGDNPLVFSVLNVVATVPDLAEGLPSVRVRVIAMVTNPGDKLWLGQKGAIERGSLRFRMPAGFQVAGSLIGDADVPSSVVAAEGGQDVVLHERIWPTALTGTPTKVHLALAGPYTAGGTYDFSFTADARIEALTLNVQDRVLAPVPSGEVPLRDVGLNPEIRGVVTHGWTADSIARGTRVGLQITTVEAHVDPKVWLTLGVLALTIAGAVFLGKALAARRSSKAPATAPDAPEAPRTKPDPTPEHAASPEASRAAPELLAGKIRELDGRLQRGEITSFEHAARRRALEVGMTTKGRPRPHRKSRYGTGDLSQLIEDVSSRIDGADMDTLRHDLRSLLKILRGKKP